MKITFITVGKTEDAYLKDGIEKYVKRLKALYQAGNG
jgi:23S rRNA (pseudouridine1915-N3)-methyltransferase